METLQIQIKNTIAYRIKMPLLYRTHYLPQVVIEYLQSLLAFFLVHQSWVGMTGMVINSG